MMQNKTKSVYSTYKSKHFGRTTYKRPTNRIEKASCWSLIYAKKDEKRQLKFFPSFNVIHIHAIEAYGYFQWNLLEAADAECWWWKSFCYYITTIFYWKTHNVGQLWRRFRWICQHRFQKKPPHFEFSLVVLPWKQSNPIWYSNENNAMLKWTSSFWHRYHEMCKQFEYFMHMCYHFGMKMIWALNVFHPDMHSLERINIYMLVNPSSNKLSSRTCGGPCQY